MSAEFRWFTEVSFDGIDERVYFQGKFCHPSELSETELSGLINRAQFVGEPGHGADPLDIDVSGLAMTLAYVVPEPGRIVMWPLWSLH